MTDPHKRPRIVVPMLFALAAAASITFGACRQDDEDEDDFDVPMDVRNSCEDYCEQRKLCKDETNEEKCRNNCIDAMTNCQVDELDAALDQLDQCGSESCDDFIGCTINVGAQCIFGL
ncbi:hypothetical protein ENSA7_50650 [Enhygromyxa salina]|uniref:Uncharacterized protein n=1 Tax=Enhygromyxa salina TaxID=215803 RepID=A0A2S9YHI7_9BACT|nr:hypothetical protein ENSA7_50650 [Enhygromyxa salina]